MSSNDSPLQVFLGALFIFVALLGGDLIAQSVVLASQPLTLLLEVLDVTILGFNFFLKSTDLADRASFGDAGRVFATGLLVAVEDANAVLKTKDLEDHGVGAVEDEREEEGESTQIHVALRVELAGLDLHTISAEMGSAVGLNR